MKKPQICFLFSLLFKGQFQHHIEIGKVALTDFKSETLGDVKFSNF